MTGENDGNTGPSPNSQQQSEEAQPGWLLASLADLSDLDFEGPIADSKSADSQELGGSFARRQAIPKTHRLPAFSAWYQPRPE